MSEQRPAGDDDSSLAADVLETKDGRFVIPPCGLVVDDDLVRAMRNTDRRRSTVVRSRRTDPST